jgi:hypothetical protein
MVLVGTARDMVDAKQLRRDNRIGRIYRISAEIGIVEVSG